MRKDVARVPCGEQQVETGGHNERRSHVAAESAFGRPLRRPGLRRPELIRRCRIRRRAGDREVLLEDVGRGHREKGAGPAGPVHHPVVRIRDSSIATAISATFNGVGYRPSLPSMVERAPERNAEVRFLGRLSASE